MTTLITAAIIAIVAVVLYSIIAIGSRNQPHQNDLTEKQLTELKHKYASYWEEIVPMQSMETTTTETENVHDHPTHDKAVHILSAHNAR